MKCQDNTMISNVYLLPGHVLNFISKMFHSNGGVCRFVHFESCGNVSIHKWHESYAKKKLCPSMTKTALNGHCCILTYDQAGLSK